MKNTTIKQILNIARQQPDGFTISPTGEIYKGNGYAVSITNRTTTGKRLRSAIRDAINFNRRTAQKLYIGGWRDSTGKYFIDNTAILSNKKDALRVARAYNQQAIFNFKDFSTISA